MPASENAKAPYVVLCDEPGRGGGILVHALDIAPGLAAGGHPVTLIATHRDPFDAVRVSDGVTFAHVPLPYIGSGRDLIKQWSAGLKPWAGARGVLYRAPGGSCPVSILWALHRTFDRLYTIEQNVAHVDPSNPGVLIQPPPRTIARRLRNAVAARLVHRSVACSEHVRQSIIDFYGYPPGRIVACNNFTDASIFKPDADARAAFRRAHQFDDDCFVVGYLGRLHRTKRVDLIMRAFDAFRRSYDGKTVLALVGLGPAEQDLRALVQTLGLSEHVRCVGWSTQTVDWHRAFDVEVLASVYEGGPITAVEAMACGTIYIGNPVGFVAEAIEHEVNGFLIDIDKPEDVTPWLQRAAAMDTAQRDAMREAARRTVVDGYDRPVALGATLDALDAPDSGDRIRSASPAAVAADAGGATP